jgi:hypothetical protein
MMAKWMAILSSQNDGVREVDDGKIDNEPHKPKC